MLKRNDDLVRLVFEELDKAGILRDMYLIGGWCLPLYFDMFKDDDACTISVIRTMDIDLMIPNPPKFAKCADMSSILGKLGFIIVRDPLHKYAKYMHEELEIEFLIPDKGKGYNKGYSVKDINVLAQPLRYISLIQDHNILVDFKGLKVRIPSPEVFVLIKLIVSRKRAKNKKVKSERDLSVALNIGEYLLTRFENREKLKFLYNSLPKGWKKEINLALQSSSDELYEFLCLEPLCPTKYEK